MLVGGDLIRLPLGAMIGASQIIPVVTTAARVTTCGSRTQHGVIFWLPAFLGYPGSRTSNACRV